MMLINQVYNVCFCITIDLYYYKSTYRTFEPEVMKQKKIELLQTKININMQIDINVPSQEVTDFYGTTT